MIAHPGWSPALGTDQIRVFCDQNFSKPNLRTLREGCGLARDLATAFCLMLVFEGILPFLSPARWQQAMALAAQMPPRTLRLFGLGSMLLGAVLLHWVRRG